MKEKIGYVYMITNPNGKLYVGSTVNFERRRANYKRYRCKDQPKLYNSLKKYGWENHIFEVVWFGNTDEMFKYETLIGWGFNVLEPDNLNLALPKLGDVYECVSKEVKIKIGKAHKGKILSEETRSKIKASKQNVTEETKNKMSIAAKGKTVSEETRKNMSLGHIGLKPTVETREKMSLWQIGKVHSEKTKNKISEKHKGKKLSQECIDKSAKSRMKPIFQYTLDDMFIKEWESAKTASEKLNIDSSSILKCCKGNLKTSGNFKWKYKSKT